jgi:hypothetical protein
MRKTILPELGTKNRRSRIENMRIEDRDSLFYLLPFALCTSQY